MRMMSYDYECNELVRFSMKKIPSDLIHSSDVDPIRIEVFVFFFFSIFPTPK